MNKPKMKREVAIVSIDHTTDSIMFTASREAAQKFAEFGSLLLLSRSYHLKVDPRFDFHEVLQYIKNY